MFEQLTQVVSGDPPRLASCDNGNTFTAQFVDFVNTWWVALEQLRRDWLAVTERDWLTVTERDWLTVTERDWLAVDEGLVSCG